MGIAPLLQGNTLGHRNAKTLHRLHLARVVGHQAQGLDLEQLEHVGTDGVITHVGGKAQGHVGLDGIGPLILQMIGPDLVEQADATPFLTHIQQNAAARLGDILEGGLQLEAAITAQTEQGIAGQAFRVDPAQNGFAVCDVAHDQGGVILTRAGFLKTYQRESAPGGWQFGSGHEGNAAHMVAPYYNCSKKGGQFSAPCRERP